MILDKIHNLLLGKRFYGVEIHTTDNGTDFFVIEVLKDQENLSIISKKHFSNIEKLMESLNVDIPLILGFTGQNIITKKTIKEDGYRSKILFNNNEEEFYWYEFVNKTNVFVSIARKETINKMVVEFRTKKFNIIDFSIGSLVLNSIKPLLSNTPEVYTNYKTLFFEEETLLEVSEGKGIKQNYNIGEETITNEQVTAFASIVNYFYPNELLSYDIELFSGNTEELKYKTATKYVGYLAIGFLLITLLISFFTLDYFQSKQQEVLTELGTQNTAYTKLIALENDKENKEAILKESGIQHKHSISFYVNQLIKDIPNKIVLDQLDVFPIIKKIKQNQIIEFQRNKIIIVGNVNDNEILNNWIQKLKTIDWINNIEINDYHKVKNNNSFTLKLSID